MPFSSGIDVAAAAAAVGTGVALALAIVVVVLDVFEDGLAGVGRDVATGGSGVAADDCCCCCRWPTMLAHVLLSDELVVAEAWLSLSWPDVAVSVSCVVDETCWPLVDVGSLASSGGWVVAGGV